MNAFKFVAIVFAASFSLAACAAPSDTQVAERPCVKANVAGSAIFTCKPAEPVLTEQEKAVVTHDATVYHGAIATSQR